ncbi:MAG: ABC transporter permease [Clostridia bacterium]|nr:ABC transporter permease [Clostridia bacterium]
MNVKNSSCIRKLAIKTLKKSAKRNIIAVAAIVLTTLLITSIFSVAFSFKTASETFNGKVNGCSADFYLDKLTSEQEEELLGSSTVKEFGHQIKVGSYSEQEFGNKPLEISYSDEQSMKWCFAEPTVGRAPEKVNEIVVDTGVLAAFGLPEKLGTTLNLNYYGYDSNGNPVPVAASFEVVGIYDENTIGPCHYVLVSKEYAESVSNISRLNVTISGDSYDFIENVVTEFGVVQCGQYGISEEESTDIESLLIVGIFLLVIGFSGYLIIYNIFQISVVNDISYYGLLKTIGVTGKQLKKIIRIQALILSVIGIPVGLVLGFLVGMITSPVIFSATIFASVSDSFSVSHWIFVVSCVFALITVFISCSKPGRIASKISPVEAFRYNEVKVDNKNNKKVSGLSGMAMRNLARNKKKTILVFFSMALPIVILSLGISFADSMSFEKYYSADFAFKVSNSTYYNYDIPESLSGYVKDFVSNADIENINSEINFGISGSAYTLSQMSETGDDKLVVMTGLDDNLFDYVEVIDGDIAPLFDPNSNAIAISMASQLDKEIKVGDKVTVDYNYNQFTDKRTGEVIIDLKALNGIPVDQIEPERIENPKEYEICAIVDPSFDLYIGYLMTDSYALVLPTSKLQSDCDGKMYRYLTVFDSPASNDIEAADEFVKSYCEKNGLQYRSAATERSEFQSLENTIRQVTITLCIVLLIIGILNFVNAVLTGILTRSHEFAVLKAIGMTDKQQKKVLIIEGLYYVIGSILLGMAVYSVLHFPFVAFFKGLDYINPQYSLVPMAVIAVVFVIFGVLIPYIVYSNVAKKTVVERLRVNE